MTREEAIKHLKLMQSGARNAIRFKKNDKEISEEERKEDIEIYQDQLAALKIATNALEQEPILDKIRAEIAQELIPRESDQYDHEAMWQNCGLRMALKVIDKY